MITLRELNDSNRRFWKEQNELVVRRMADEAIRDTAFARLSDERTRGVPLYNQATIEKLLADAEGDKSRFLSQQGRKGRQARKPDALQQAIVDLARTHPKITVARLRELLTRERFPKLIEDDEEAICFVEADGSGRERLKEAPISGLKHRLSRAKKILRSR